jgi:hypothetical protein
MLHMIHLTIQIPLSGATAELPWAAVFVFVWQWESVCIVGILLEVA